MYRKGISLMYIGSLITLLFFLTPAIDNYRYNFFSKKGVAQEDMFYKTLGDIRKIFSDYSYIKADLYFHGGIYKKDEKECAKTEDAHGEDKCADDNEHFHKKNDKLSSVSKISILPYIGEIIRISKHMHLHGKEEQEILPWLYYSTRLNPENIDAYVTGSYWIGQRLNKPDEAIKFLREGLIHNPGSWEIYTQLGEVYFVNKKDYKKALFNFEKAYGLITDKNSDKFGKRELYSFLAASYENFGDIEKVLELYRKILALFPQDKAVQKKIISFQSRPLSQ